MTDHDNAFAALDAVNHSRERLAQRMHWPLWRHAACGLLFGLLITAMILPDGWAIAIIALVLALTFLIVRDDKRRHGMFVSGYQRGRTGIVIAAMMAVFGAAAVSVFALVEDGSKPLGWIIVGVVFVAATALSYVWEVVYRADIRADRT